jgi:hypothetical protein
MTTLPAQILQRLQRPATARVAPATALDADARTVRGVCAERGAGGVLSVTAAAMVEVAAPSDAERRMDSSEDAPADDAPLDDAPATPVGLSREERAALGLGDGPALVALPREQVLLGEMELPSDDEAEVRSMARLALGRDYAIEGVETATVRNAFCFAACKQVTERWGNGKELHFGFAQVVELRL